MERKSERRKDVELITEELFREAYLFEEARKPPLKKVIAKHLECTKNTVMNLFPASRWLPKYSIKNHLVSDIMAGITVAIMHVPHGLAYAPLGKAEPVVGFYMAVFPVFIYIFMGTSRHISIGTFAVLCAMVGQIVHNHEIPQDYDHESSNSTTTTQAPDIVHKFKAYEVGSAVCLLVGLWQTILGFLRLGFLTVIMSESLISGFTTGAAVHVISYQLKNLFGVNVASFSGTLKLLYIYIDFFSKIKTVNIATMSMSLGCITFLLIFTLGLNPLIQRKCPKNRVPIPIELLVIIIGILISYFSHLSEKYNVRVVGHIPTGFPQPSPPPLPLLPSLLLETFIAAVVALAINLSLAKIFAKKGDYSVSNNQELIAYGVANVFASFFQCLPSAASLSRSSIQFAAGGKSQLASLFSLMIVIIILLAAGSLFEPVPYCVLSSIVVVSLKGLLLQVADLPKIFRESYWDGIVWLGTFLSVIVLDLDYGLGVGVILSLLSLLFSSQSLQFAVMGRVPNTNIFLEVDYFRSARTIPNIHILQIIGIMSFANNTMFEHRMIKEFKNLTESSSKDETYIILNMASVSRIDPTAVNTLTQIYRYLKKSKCDLYLTDCNLNVYRTFEVCEFFKEFPKEQVLASVSDAVEFLTNLT